MAPPFDVPSRLVRRPVTWKYLRRFLAEVRPFWPYVAVIIYCSLLVNLLVLVLPLGLKIVIDSVIPDRDLRMLHLLSVAIIILVLFRAAVGVFQQYGIIYVGERVVNKLRRRLYDHLQLQDLPTLDGLRPGGIISRVVGDVESIRGLLFGGFVNLISNSVRLVVVFAAMLVISWKMTLISCAFLPFFAVVFLRLRRRLRPAWLEIRELWARATARMAEVFGGARVVKAYAQEKRESAEFAGEVNWILRRTLNVHGIQLSLRTLADLTGQLGIIALLWYGGFLVVQGEILLGELIAFQFLVLLLLQPLAEIVMINNQLQFAMASIERMFDVLDTQPEIRNRPGAVTLSPVRGEIAFENVSFRYDRKDSRYALREVGFRAEPGETVALVGPSGAGKTTVTSLLARFYDVAEGEGRILVDGRDLRNLELQSYRRQIALVLQGNFLFDATVRENIAYGRPGATEAAVREAARRANALSFIDKMPRGLETVVGERGHKLSEGERQRLSIARAFLVDPRILILDEATSSVETESEALIQEAMAELARGPTTFIIAHRLSTVTAADRILVLDEGRLVESGTHEELLSRRGLYHKMFMEQYRRVRLPGEAAEDAGAVD